METLTTTKLEKALKIGGSEWEAYGKHRVYFSKEVLLSLYGLEYSTYKSGSVASAKLDGEKISNGQAQDIVNACRMGKAFYDVKEDKVVTTNGLGDYGFGNIIREKIEA